MKIGLNATCFNNRPSGARQRFIGIYSALIARLPEAEFVIYEPEDCAVAAWFRQFPNVSGRRTPVPSEGRRKKFLRGARYWPAALAAEGLDVFEVFNLPAVRAPTGHTVLTIHDLRGMRAECNLAQRAANRMLLQQSLRAVDRVITVSEAMRGEIHRVAPDVPVSVVYNGLDASAFAAPADAALSSTRDKYQLPRQFILAVGHLEARKNYLRLLEAIAHLSDKGVAIPLVIVGNDSGLKGTIEAKIAALGLSGRATILNDLSDQDVRCLYRLCSLLVFPSVYEGFGIPILEAMASGCPMALSDTPVFREITQHQAVYFPPTDARAMACAMEQVLTAGSERAHWVEYGRTRVEAFNFSALAAQLETVYRSLMR